MMPPGNDRQPLKAEQFWEKLTCLGFVSLLLPTLVIATPFFLVIFVYCCIRNLGYQHSHGPPDHS